MGCKKTEVKHVEVDAEIHSILKERARKKGCFIKFEANKVLRAALGLNKEGEDENGEF